MSYWRRTLQDLESITNAGQVFIYHCSVIQIRPPISTYCRENSCARQEQFPVNRQWKDLRKFNCASRIAKNISTFLGTNHDNL